MDTSSYLDSKWISLLKDSILISTNISNKNDIVFDLISEKEDGWSKYHLKIRNINNFYFQRYETSFQRSGLANIHRIKIKNKESEWINQVKSWKNTFTKEEGVEFSLYNGSKFRFVGSKLTLEPNFVEGPIELVTQYRDAKPDSIKKSVAKVITNESFPKFVKDKVQTPIIIQNDDSVLVEELREKIPNTVETGSYQELNQDINNINPQLSDEVLDTIDNLTNEEPLKHNNLEDEANKDFSEDVSYTKIDNKQSETEQKKLMKLEERDEIKTQNNEFSMVNQLSEFAYPDQTNNLISDKRFEAPGKILDFEDIQQTIELVTGVTESNKANIERLGFETIEKLSNAKIAELIKIHGIGKATARKIIQSAKNIVKNNKQ